MSNDPQSAKPTSGVGTVLWVITALCIGFSIVMQVRYSKVITQSELATQSLLTCSNQVEELRKLALTRSDATVTASNNLHAILEKNRAITDISNRWHQARMALGNIQGSLDAAQLEIQKKHEEISLLESRQLLMQQCMTNLLAVQNKLSYTQTALAQTTEERDVLTQKLNYLQIEIAKLHRNILDHGFLVRQSKIVQEMLSAQKRRAQNGKVDLADPRLVIALKPDGTVHTVMSSTEIKREKQ